MNMTVSNGFRRLVSIIFALVAGLFSSFQMGPRLADWIVISIDGPYDPGNAWAKFPLLFILPPIVIVIFLFFSYSHTYFFLN